MASGIPSKTDKIVEQLADYKTLKIMRYDQCHAEALPSSGELQEIITLCRSLLFPGFFGPALERRDNLGEYIGQVAGELFSLLRRQITAGLCFQPDKCPHDGKTLQQQAEEKARAFMSVLPELREKLEQDVIASYNGDPAAESLAEVIACYPGIRAVSSYRIAHALYGLDVPGSPRMITEMAHSETGIDIHPAARIGISFAIDHGTGVVIGATTIIGDRVKLYQGVTLGAKSFPLDENGHPIKGILRHPILEDDVIIYANSTILGRVTIGRGAIIGGNVWVTEDVPAGARVMQSKKKSL